MYDPLDFKSRPQLERLAWMQRRAWLVIARERFAFHFWRILSWSFLFFGLWLMNVQAFAGTVISTLLLIVFTGGFLFLLWKDVRKFRLPRRAEADRRLERDSALPHRPIGALKDTLANPRLENTRKLWEQNRTAMFGMLGSLKPALKRKVLTREDPYALRFTALAIFIVGAFAAGSHWQERLEGGLMPLSAATLQTPAERITLWITPPRYTHLPQISVQVGQKYKKPFEIPEGSIVKLRVAGGFMAPRLNDVPLEKLDGGNWGAESTIEKPAAEDAAPMLTVTQFPVTRFKIPYTYIPDRPPTLALNGEATNLPKGQLRIPLKVKDDYGVTQLSAMLTLDPMVTEAPIGGAPVEQKRSIMSPAGKETELTPVYDFAWHTWAGLPVVITLSASDEAGHTATQQVKMTLPERDFNNPVAKKLIEMRKRLAWTPDDAEGNVSSEIEDLMVAPYAFNNDKNVFLSLRSMSSRLLYNEGDREAVRQVISQMWDTAVRVEDGSLSDAEKNLQQAQKNLEDLLQNPNATKEQIAQAMNDLRQAMASYFQELAKDMQKRIANGEKMPPLPQDMMKTMTPEDLAAFLDQMQSQAMSGDKDAARRMLSQLGEAMDQLGAASNFKLPKDMQFMMKGVSEMQKLIDSEKKLVEQTKQQATEEKPDTQKNKAEQDALRYVLGQLMLEADEKLGQIPQNMQEAEKAMRDSAQQLAENKPALAVPPQEEAVKKLQEAQQEMSKKFGTRMRQMQMLSLGGGGRLDPLGRPMDEDGGNSLLSGDTVKIPDEAERKRVQEILKTLRDKAGDLQRPDYELDYLRRLMRQF